MAGIIAWFRKLFTQEKIEKVELKDLENWILHKRARNEGEFKEWLIDWQRENKEIVLDYTHAVGDLKTAELTNKNIPEHHKQVMEGNRQEFIRKAGSLLEGTKVPHNIEEAREYAKSATQKIEDFSKNTQKQIAVLSQFLAVQTRKVLENISKIEKLTNDLKKEINNKMPVSFLLLETELFDFIGAGKRAEELKKEKDEKEQRIKEMREKTERIEEERAKHQGSAESKELETLRKEEAEVHDNKRKAITEIIHEMQMMDDAISRHAIKSDLPLKFLSDIEREPINVIRDQRERFDKLMKEINEGLQKGTIDITERKLERAKEASQKLCGEWLKEQLKKEEEFALKEIELYNKINSMDIVSKTAKLNKELKTLHDEMQRINEETRTLSAKIEKLESKEKYDQLQKAGKDAGIEITYASMP